MTGLIWLSRGQCKPISGCAAGSVEPAVEAIREDRFYVLAPEDNGWRAACNVRLEDIRLARNPSLAVPGS